MAQTVKIKRIADANGNLPELPQYASPGAAGCDLRFFSAQPVTLAPGERTLAPTGISIELPQGFAALLFARSGLAVKNGIALSNGVGVIDCDYRGEIKVGLINLSSESYTISPGDRIAQLVFIQSPQLAFLECSEISGTDRDNGGFGSTGKR